MIVFVIDGFFILLFYRWPSCYPDGLPAYQWECARPVRCTRTPSRYFYLCFPLLFSLYAVRHSFFFAPFFLLFCLRPLATLFVSADDCPIFFFIGLTTKIASTLFAVRRPSTGRFLLCLCLQVDCSRKPRFYILSPVNPVLGNSL